MKKTTLCFCVKDGQVLLAMKKSGFGAGKWNGYGGKVEGEETPRGAAARELNEESGLVAAETDLRQVALVRFYFDNNPVFECYVYLTDKWEGEPIETEEMGPVAWHSFDQLPYDAMWAADARWLPLILSGEVIDADVRFNTDGSVVEDFSYKPLTLADV